MQKFNKICLFPFALCLLQVVAAEEVLGQEGQLDVVGVNVVETVESENPSPEVKPESESTTEIVKEGAKDELLTKINKNKEQINEKTKEIDELNQKLHKINEEKEQISRKQQKLQEDGQKCEQERKRLEDKYKEIDQEEKKCAENRIQLQKAEEELAKAEEELAKARTEQDELRPREGSDRQRDERMGGSKKSAEDLKQLEASETERRAEEIACLKKELEKNQLEASETERRAEEIACLKKELEKNERKQREGLEKIEKVRNKIKAGEIYEKVRLENPKLDHYEFMVILAKALLADPEYNDKTKDIMLDYIDNIKNDIKIREIMDNVEETKRARTYYEFKLRVKQSKLGPVSIFSFGIFYKFFLQMQISVVHILALIDLVLRPIETFISNMFRLLWSGLTK